MLVTCLYMHMHNCKLAFGIILAYLEGIDDPGSMGLLHWESKKFAAINWLGWYLKSNIIKYSFSVIRLSSLIITATARARKWWILCTLMELEALEECCGWEEVHIGWSRMVFPLNSPLLSVDNRQSEHAQDR